MQEFKDLRRWVCWRLENKNGKDTKVPYNARTGGHADSTEPATWSSYEEAREAASDPLIYDGIGFVIDEPYCGIDLDKCIKDGVIAPWAQNILDQIDSYSEFSPTRTGVHIWTKGRLSGTGRKRRYETGVVEIYDRGRYFTWTGEWMPETPSDVRKRDVKWLYDLIQESSTTPTGSPGSKPNLIVRTPADYERLFAGHWQEFYSSQSEADLSMCRRLARLHNNDRDKVDEEFRKSGLYREKWDRDYYRNRTLNIVLGPPSPPQKSSTSLPEAPPSFALAPYFSERALSQRWAQRFLATTRYLDRGVWIIFRGDRWREDVSEILVPEVVGRFLQESIKEVDEMFIAADGEKPERVEAAAKQMRSKLCSASCQKNVLGLARQQPGIFLEASELDQNPWLLGVPGGVIDLRDGSTREADPADYISKVAKIAPGGECPRWRQFLTEITNGDNDFAAYLQRLMGSWLTGSVKDETLAVLYGTGGNGKGTLVKTAQEILGPYSATIPLSVLLSKQHSDQDLNHLANMCGARLVIANEGDKRRAMNAGLIKTLTGGDRIAAKHLYENPFEFSPTHKLVILTNHRPQLEIDDAIRRRLQLVSFQQKFEGGKKDPDLKEKLVKEYPGILAWAIEGCRSWLEQGLNPPKHIVDLTNEYLAEYDDLEQWLDERCVRYGSSATNDLFADWTNWAAVRKVVQGSMKTFSQDLKKKGFQKKDTKNVRGFSDLALRNGAEPLIATSPLNISEEEFSTR